MDPIIKHGWHWEFGWLRRPENDQDGMFCYEEPDGDLILSARPAHEIAIYLDCRVDTKTGEKYTCFAKIPRKPMKHDTSVKSSNPCRNAKG
jgi:hypothetical protein